MTRGNRTAFTLVELMVVVAIVIFIATVGMVNYLNFQDRQRLENTAKELIVWLRGVQLKARAGDRGEVSNDCRDASPEDIANGNAKLDRWQAKLSPQREDGNYKIIDAGIICHDKDSGGGITYEYHDPQDSFSLPQHLTLTTYVTDNTNAFDDTTQPSEGHVLAFDAVYGQIYFLPTGITNEIVDPGGKSALSNGRFILTDGQFYYTFLLENGTFTSGCTCKSEVDCERPELKC